MNVFVNFSLRLTPVFSIDGFILQVIIVAPDSLVRCDDLVVGEIWVNSGSKAGGYFGKPEETLMTFHAVTSDGQGQDNGGYLRTGDMGFFHEGQLYITGRLKVAKYLLR